MEAVDTGYVPSQGAGRTQVASTPVIVKDGGGQNQEGIGNPSFAPPKVVAGNRREYNTRMQDEHAFTHALLDHPEDESLRLIFSDWLEERGGGWWSRSICQLARFFKSSFLHDYLQPDDRYRGHRGDHQNRNSHLLALAPAPRFHQRSGRTLRAELEAVGSLTLSGDRLLGQIASAGSCRTGLSDIHTGWGFLPPCSSRSRDTPCCHLE
jgi:uncharacterized protein (TIGR02996 family)